VIVSGRLAAFASRDLSIARRTVRSLTLPEQTDPVRLVTASASVIPVVVAVAALDLAVLVWIGTAQRCHD
jgi:hypothetical protein